MGNIGFTMDRCEKCWEFDADLALVRHWALGIRHQEVYRYETFCSV